VRRTERFILGVGMSMIALFLERRLGKMLRKS
jgi:hypothetical protein